MERRIMERAPYSLAQAFRDICTGTQPWVAINEFLHEWLDYARDRREALIAEPIAGQPSSVGAESWRWAVFCAAVAEWLCECDHMPPPAWVDDPRYTLAETWYGFDAPGAAKPQVRDHLERTTPEPFRRRNIFCGNRVLASKYDLPRGRQHPSPDLPQASEPPAARE